MIARFDGFSSCDHALASSNNYLYCIRNTATGPTLLALSLTAQLLIWAQPLATLPGSSKLNAIQFTVIVDNNGTVIYSQSNGLVDNIVGVDAATGSTLWIFNGGGSGVRMAATSNGEIIALVYTSGSSDIYYIGNGQEACPT